MLFSPHEYQQDLIKKIVNDKAAFIIAAMGSGKTAATLEAIDQLFSCFEIGRVLIIAPLRVAEHTWPAEIVKWENFDQLSLAVATGPLKKRTAAIAKGADITVINQENIPWLVTTYGKKWPFDMVVVDESSSFKNASSQRFKALKKIRGMVGRWVLLTGTPTPNSLLELWSQVYLLDGGERLGRAFGGFKNRYFESDYMGYNVTIRPGAGEQIQAAVSDLCVVVESYAGLPARVDLTEEITLSRSVRAMYDDMVKEMIIEIDSDEITAVNAAVKVGKLQQIASGAVYDQNKNTVLIHSEKIDALTGLIESAEGENVLIAYNYRHEFDRIKEAIPHAVDIKDKGAIDRWNAGEIRVLLAHPASAGHGLNLWSGGNRIIWFSPTWSTELKLQFDARLHRQGQTKPVFVHSLIATDTIDQDIVGAVDTKESAQTLLIRSVKAKPSDTKV